MRAETVFVLSLARGDLRAAMAAAKHGLDVEEVLRLASFHQVEALCSWCLKGSEDGETWTSDPALAFLARRLREAYLHHLLRNESLVRDLADLQGALAARGQEAIYLKGPWLAFRAYPDPGTRPVGDIDLLVREQGYREAVAAIRDAGYLPATPVPESPDEALARMHYGGQLRFGARSRRPLELHLRLVNMGPPREDEGWVWDTSRDLQIGGLRLRAPGREAMLLQLILHANQHGFSVLRLLHDIRFWLEWEGAEIDCGLLVSLVQDLRCPASAYHALLLARDLAGARPPERLLEVWRASATRRAIFSLVWRLRAVRRLEAPRWRLQAEAPRFYLLEMGGVREKTRYLRGVLRQAGGMRAFLASATSLLVSEQAGNRRP